MCNVLLYAQRFISLANLVIKLLSSNFSQIYVCKNGFKFLCVWFSISKIFHDLVNWYLLITFPAKLTAAQSDLYHPVHQLKWC